MALPHQHSLHPRTMAEAVPGLVLATLIAGSWLAVHIATIFLVEWNWPSHWPVAVAVIGLQTWLSVGLFIIAHDCMHGSLAPGRPGANKWVGRLVVALYAGFSYDRLQAAHHLHHRHPGTELDPDFDPVHPTRFWPWYFRFFRTYFAWRELAILSAVALLYAAILRQDFVNALLFWAIPALLSSVQLFYFGTFRPHHVDETPFADRHRARSNDFPHWLSVLTCFNFGYHHEHHEKPGIPWWRLARYRELRREQASGRHGSR